MPEESLDVVEVDTMSSVDDFIKELEAKEKDLHITSDMTIEIEESEFATAELPEFDAQGVAVPVAGSPLPQGVSAQVPGSKTRIFELQNEVEKLNERIAGLRADRSEIQEKSDRRLKDFENYKYRMDRERRGAFIDQISNLATQMLPVLDNLNRALDSADSLKSKKSDDFQKFYDGIVLVNQQVNEVFCGMGVEPIKTVGETFDPNFHEAVAIEDREDIPANTILDELLRGYRIGNRVIRHSMVKVTAVKPLPRAEIQTTAVDLDPETPPNEVPPSNESEQPTEEVS